MKPNRKDSQVQVPPPATVNSSTSTTAATYTNLGANAATKTSTTSTTNVKSTTLETLKNIDEQHSNLRCNVSLIGWMGVIASLTVMLCTGLTMQWCNEVVRLIMAALRRSNELEHSRSFLRRLVIMVSTFCYSLSAVNVIMNTLLLLGVRRRTHALILPWLLFHGFIFGLCVHMAMYMTISGLLVDFKVFVILLATFTLALVVFFKVSFEVFLLYKAMRKENLDRNDMVNAQVNTDNYAYFTLASTEA